MISLTMGHARVDLNLVLDTFLVQSILADHPHLIWEHWVVLYADQAHRNFEVKKVVGADQGGVGQCASLDIGALGVCLAGLLVFRLGCASPARLKLLTLRCQEEDVAGTEAVADGVDPVPSGDGVGELGLGRVNDLFENGQDLFLRVAGEPHVDHEALGRLGHLELGRVEPRGATAAAAVLGLAALGLVDGLGVGRRVPLKQVRHHHDVAFRGESVGLDLVVGGLEAGAARQVQHELCGRGRVGGWLGNVDLK